MMADEKRSRISFDENSMTGEYRLLPASSSITRPSRSTIGLDGGLHHALPFVAKTEISCKIMPDGNVAAQKPRNAPLRSGRQSETKIWIALIVAAQRAAPRPRRLSIGMRIEWSASGGPSRAARRLTSGYESDKLSMQPRVQPSRPVRAASRAGFLRGGGGGFGGAGFVRPRGEPAVHLVGGIGDAAGA